MSMDELEDLVEMSVKLLARSDLPRSRLRSLYYNLFEFEACFDTGFTHFRTMDELVAARFVYRLSPSQHPTFAEHASYFASLTRFTFLDIPGQEDDGGYFKPPYLYCDAGSKLWQRLVERGALTGRDTQPPEVMPIQQVLAQVAEQAELVGDRRVIAYCYRLLLWALVDEDPETLRSDAAVAVLRDLVRRTRALEVSLDHGSLQDPPPEELTEAPAAVRYWFDLAS